MELQKSIEGYENYEININGFAINISTGKSLKMFPVSKGYFQVHLCKGGKKKGFYIHRLIGLAFIPNPYNKPFINHKNGIRTDNRIENLEWTTPKENINHAYKIGLCPTRIKALQGSKLTESQVLELREKLSNKQKVKDLSKAYGIHQVSINNIKRRKTWKHI